MKILVIGELNVDLMLRDCHAFPQLGRETLVEDATLTLGSASAICAAGLARLGNDVGFIGKLGCDAWGDLVMETLEGLGVDVSHVLRDPAIKTGITVSITSSKDRALVTYPGSIEALRREDIDEGWLRGFSHLHVSSFFLQRGLRPGLKALLAGANQRGLSTSIDPGCDPEDRWDEDLLDALAETDIFLPNEVELRGITHSLDIEEGLRRLDNGRARTIAKLGACGSMTLDGGRVIAVPAFAVDAVDTTGAGDSFNAGFLHAWLGGSTILESMRFGSVCGSLSTLGLGGTTAQPMEAEVVAFLAARSGEHASSRKEFP